MQLTSVINACVVLFCVFEIIRADLNENFFSFANAEEFVNKENEGDSNEGALNVGDGAQKDVVKRDADSNEGAVNGNVDASMPPAKSPIYSPAEHVANDAYHQPLAEADLASESLLRYSADSKREDAVNDVVNTDLDGGGFNQYPGLPYPNPVGGEDTSRGLGSDLDEEMKKESFYRDSDDGRMPFAADFSRDFVKRDVGSAIRDSASPNNNQARVDNSNFYRQGRQANEVSSAIDDLSVRPTGDKLNMKYLGMEEVGGKSHEEDRMQYRPPRFSGANITTRVKNYPDQVIIVGQPMTQAFPPIKQPQPRSDASNVKRNDTCSLDVDANNNRNSKFVTALDASKMGTTCKTGNGAGGNGAGGSGPGAAEKKVNDICDAEGSPEEAAAFNELMRKMYALEARVKMETRDSDKAAQRVKDTQRHLEELTNRIVVLRTDMRWAQLDAGEAGRRNMEEDAKGAVHTKALFELQQKMEGLRTQLANTEMHRCRRKAPSDCKGSCGGQCDPNIDAEYRKQAEALAREEAAASLEGAAVCRSQQISAVATRRVQEAMAKVYNLRDQLESAQSEAVAAAQKASEADTDRRKKDDQLAASKQGLSELYHQRTMMAAASNARMKREVGEGFERTRREMESVEKAMEHMKGDQKKSKRSKREVRSCCKAACTPAPYKACNVCPDPPDPHPQCPLPKGEAQHRKVVQLRMFEESRVAAEKKEVAKAEQVAATAHKRLQEALAKVQILKREIARIQKEAERAAAGTKRAQACFEEHDQRKFEARRRVDALYTMLTNVEIDECKKSKRRGHGERDERGALKSCDPCDTRKIEPPKKCEPIKLPKLAPCETTTPKTCEPCEQPDATSQKYNCILQQIFVAEAAVKLETAEAAKAEQNVITEHARLEAALNKLVALQTDVRNLQAQAQLIAENTKKAQAQLAYHDQLLHNAQKKVGCAVELQIDIEKYMAMHKKCKKENPQE